MSHYFTNEKDLKSNQKIHKVMIENKPFLFQTDHGVFSKKGLDFGSRLLIKNVIHLSFNKALDLGCGYGPIGLSLKAFNPKATIDMVDINERAINLAKANASLNKLKVHAFVSDGFNQINDKYDLIVTNPPIRAGKKIIYGFFEDAKKHLLSNGNLFMVIQKKQGASSAMKFCQSIYSHVEVVDKKSGYLIIKCGL